MSYYDNLKPAVPMQVFEQQNILIRSWSIKVKSRLKISASQFKRGKSGTIQRRSKFGAVRTEQKLVQSLKNSLHYANGIVDSTSFKFERHGVFVHKGVGNGYKMINGMVIRIAKSKTANPRPRVPVDWFNSTINMEVPKLADELATINADAAINAMRLRIN